MNNWKTIKTYENRYEADIAKSYLDQHNIPSFIKSDDAGGLHPGLTFTSGVEIQVPNENFQQATELIEQLDEEKAPLEIIQKKNNS